MLNSSHFLAVNITIGHEHFCTIENPCGADQGDCDSNSECQCDLYCGYNNCPVLGSEVDCCTNTQLVSPNYPNAFPEDVDETWLITAAPGMIITLEFHSYQVRFTPETYRNSKHLSEM